MTNIKHLVLSGGGIWGFSLYGALRESAKAQFWNVDNLKTIYSTSVGTMMSVMISLKYDWETLDDFLIKRPWNQVFPFNLYSIVSSVEKRGIFDKQCIHDMFAPLLKGKDLSLDITMKEFYEYSGIEIHCFSTEMNEHNFTKVDFSWKTHPDWKLLDVVYCSSCLPILFAPFLQEDKCYIDGAILSNYPLTECISMVDDPDEIFGIKKTHNENQRKVDTKSSLFEYLFYFIRIVVGQMETNQNDVEIKNQIEIKADATNLCDIFMVSTSMDERMKLIDYGAKLWDKAELNSNIDNVDI
jgi:predicted acylesterase/phospholipase RssA